MTAQKAMNIGRMGLHISWKLVTLTIVAIFGIFFVFFKIFAAYDDGAEDERTEDGWPTSEAQWDLENPNACPMEKGSAQYNGRFY